MDFFFADDARQRTPSRPEMGPLVAVGGIHVPDQAVAELESAIDSLCEQTGFPPGEEFKWSPGRELWMRDNLVGEDRQAFFIEVLTLAKQYDLKAVVVIEDAKYETATDAPNAEEDVTRLFLERAHWQFKRAGTKGVVIADRPGGGRTDEDSFLAMCLETLQSGTRYVRLDRIALNVLSTPSKLVRLLQVADVVTSCTVAFVGGEEQYAPPVFEHIRPLFPSHLGRIGGVGLKIHPDAVYANLYYWLLGDRVFVKRGSGMQLPTPNCRYCFDPNEPWLVVGGTRGDTR